MIEALENCIERMKQLPEADQARLAEVVDGLLSELSAGVSLADDLQDPAYRAYVEDALERAEASIAAGRTATLGEVREKLVKPFKAKHGL